VTSPAAGSHDGRPLVLHVVHRFDTGGLENGLVNLINHMPVQAYRHLVVALTEVTDFKLRVKRDDVRFLALHKKPGQGLWLYPEFARLLAAERPAVVHTRNLGTLEFQLPAAWMRTTARVHGEHGRDIDDLDGSSRRHRWLRRAYGPFVHRFVALSNDLSGYLKDVIGVAPARIVQIYNGVDSQRFAPAGDASQARSVVEACPFQDPRLWLVGTVGRLQAVKSQTLLAKAFVLALQQEPALRQRMRLVIVGGGPLMADIQAILAEAGMSDLAWLAGERSDVADVMRMLDCFVLPSLAEGVSNTILEAMASGLPVLATRVGANPELVEQGRSGLLVPASDAAAMAQALRQLFADPPGAQQMGRAGRDAAVQRFSMQAMANRYQGLYDSLLGAKTR
jgi:sugar transferase (PEP-CTERM/EpsH1 system associated)